MILQLLADAAVAAPTPPASPDTLISGSWLIAAGKTIIVALGTAGAAWIVALKRGEAKGKASKVTVQDPVPEVPVRRVYSPPSFSQHMDLQRRVEKMEEVTLDLRNDFYKALEEIRKEGAKQYVEILNAGHERETRLLEKMDGIARGIHNRINELIPHSVKK